MKTLSGDTCELDEVVKAIPHDQSYTHEGLRIKQINGHVKILGFV
jgi:hypothetical protein